MTTPDPREDAALDALITASLHVADREVTEAEAQAFLQNLPELSPEQEAALAAWQPDLFIEDDDGFCGSLAQTPTASTELYTAMNRNNADDEHTPEAEAELERRRKEALERLKKKQRPGGE